jgi:4-amino-4-deoxy-L-arabinose transferase-like glycosyltransferase
VLVIGFGRAASTDMPLTAMFTMAMLAWYAWYSTDKRLWLLLFYFFLALATLAKGPVAVLLTGLILAVFAALRRDARLILRTLWPFGVLLYLAVALPWFVAVQRANPDFFRVFILEHNVARFATDLYRHKEPFWYYLPVALLGLLPWTVFTTAAVVDAIRDWRYSVEEPAGREDLRTFLTLWLLLPILFFSLSQSKLPGYILPAIPAGAILLADFILRREEDQAKPSLWIVLLHAAVAAGMLVAAFIIPFHLAGQPVRPVVWLVAAALALACMLLLVLAMQNQGYRVLRFTTLVPVVIAFALTLKGTAPLVDYQQSARWVVHDLNQTAVGQIPVLAVYDVPRGLEYGLEFYRNRPVLSYERNEIPPGDHLVVAAAGAKTELEYRLKDRNVTRIGGFAPQHVDFYLVSGSKGAIDHP